jgi:hypothetical protein
MSTPATPPQPTPAGDDRNLVAIDPSTMLSFEDRVTLFWEKNRKIIYLVCGLIVGGIVGRGALDYSARQKELAVQAAYAAATTNDQLKSFASAHTGHALAGVALVRIADTAYQAGKAAEAVSAYDSALSALKTGPLAARAKLGRALSKAVSGKVADGTAELKTLADDTAELKSIRAEALYHLTSLAVDAVNAADAQKYVDQLMKLDVSSSWTQRAMALRASLPAAPAAAEPAKAGAPASGVEVKLPGK